MMGKRVFAPKLYYQLSLDQLIPQDHLLRQIATLIDFSFIYPLAKPYYSYTGQPSVDPIVIFKTLLIGYLYGITSERRLMNEIQVNLAYRWFVGYDLDETIPDHSVLTKARSRFGMDVFEEFFIHSIELCSQAGLLCEGPVFVDSTLIQSAASLDSVVRREEIIKPPLPVEEYVRKLYKDNELALQNADAGSEENTLTPECEIRDNNSSTTSQESGHENNPNKPSRKSNAEYVSRTDPEATLVNNRKMGLKLAYKAHMAVSGKNGRVITAAIATTGAKADEHVLGEVLQYHNKITGLAVKEVVADARYGTLANFVSLNQAGITAYIPPHERQNEPNGIWGRDRFHYVEEQDYYLCPENKQMKRFTTRRCNKRFAYHCEPGTCEVCQFNKQCTRHGNARTISRFIDQKLVENTKKRLVEPVGKELFKQRKTMIEGVFALAKQFHGLRRAQFIGKLKVQIQIWLTAAVINLRRALKELSKRVNLSNLSILFCLNLYSLRSFK